MRHFRSEEPLDSLVALQWLIVQFSYLKTTQNNKFTYKVTQGSWWFYSGEKSALSGNWKSQKINRQTLKKHGVTLDSLGSHCMLKKPKPKATLHLNGHLASFVLCCKGVWPPALNTATFRASISSWSVQPISIAPGCALLAWWDWG